MIFLPQHDYIFCHKVAQRRTSCRSAVSCGFRVTFEPEGHKVSDLCLVFGGVDANPAVAQKTCNSLIGQWVILSSILMISKRLDQLWYWTKNYEKEWQIVVYSGCYLCDNYKMYSLLLRHCMVSMDWIFYTVFTIFHLHFQHKMRVIEFKWHCLVFSYSSDNIRNRLNIVYWFDYFDFITVPATKGLRTLCVLH